MEQKGTIFTYGKTLIDAEELTALLRPLGVNCVVDCRPRNGTDTPGNTPSKEMGDALGRHGIAYIPFHRHFGVFPTDKKGLPDYGEAIKTECFLQGAERISDGVRKGFRICVIDNEPDTRRSARLTLIGRYLSGQHQVYHIDAKGHYFSQEQTERRMDGEAEERKRKAEAAQAIGRTGEELAARYLMDRGFRIIDRNWNLHRGCELDIVALKDRRLHFVEVKTRSSGRWGAPELAIDREKMGHLFKAIAEYRRRRGWWSAEFQLDSIAIVYRGDTDYELRHFPDIRP